MDKISKIGCFTRREGLVGSSVSLTIFFINNCCASLAAELFDRDNSTCISTNITYLHRIPLSVSGHVTVTVVGKHFRCDGRDLQFYISETSGTSCGDEEGIRMKRCILVAVDAGSAAPVETIECGFECNCDETGGCREGFIKKKQFRGTENVAYFCELVLQ